MASVASDPNGRKRLLFFDVSAERQTIRLGKVPLDSARTVARQVDLIVSARRLGEPIREETAVWLESLGDELHGKLADAGLVTRREQHALGIWLDKYVASRESNLEPSSVRKLRQTCSLFKEFFTADRSIRSITPADASDWRDWLRKRLSEATAKIHSGNAKTIFAEAVRRELMTKNPFLHLPTGPTPREAERYVTEAELEKILALCPDAEWKLWFALPFYATVRVPSETQEMTWADVDFEKGRLNVRDQKRARYGKGRRVIPVAPRLAQLLQEQLDRLPAGTRTVLQLRCTGYVKDRMSKLVKESGVTPWEDLFVTLRASGEAWRQEQGFDVAHTAEWAGHSTTVSRRHYVKSVPESILDRASGRTAEAAQKAAQQTLETGGNGGQPVFRPEVENGTTRHLAASYAGVWQNGEMGVEGLEPPTSRV